MANPHTVVIIGGIDDDQASLKTQLQPVKSDQKLHVAIANFFHGEVQNINSTNNKILFEVPEPLNDESEARIRSVHGLDKDEVIPIDKYNHVSKVLELPIGYYPSVISILEKISLLFKNIHLETNYHSVEVGPPKFVCNFLNSGYIECHAENMQIPLSFENSPWTLLGFDDGYFGYSKIRQLIKNHEFSKDLIPALLYMNIVEDSYINGQLSRVLSTIPIRMKKEWSFHQFNNLNFVPINVKEFSTIYVEILDLDGKRIRFNPKYKTIITLQIKQEDI